MSRPQLQVVTIAVSSLTQSKRFYEELLGFEPDIYYEPTRWQSYKLGGGGGFGIAEAPALVRADTIDIINFTVDDVETLWERVRDRVTVDAPLATTPWGAHKFVIRDPDGFRLGFVGR